MQKGIPAMELNKIVAGLCGALLVFLGLNFFAEKVFHPHHTEELAFALEIEEDDGAEEVVEEKDFAAIFAAADASAGEGVFRKCAACHAVEDGDNKVGPHLWGVINRQIGAVDGASYSGNLPEGEAWTPQNLYAFLEAPRKWAPGTSMGFAGLRKSEDRADLIAYLNELDGSPEPLE
ncbi:MAG: cytochrome c family protein [Pseudomonadota bacterium]